MILELKNCNIGEGVAVLYASYLKRGKAGIILKNCLQEHETHESPCGNLPSNSSFVVLDVGGEILKEGIVAKSGYQIKVLNLIEPEKSLCYNPFEYLRCEKDVSVLARAIIKHTYLKAKHIDEFWDRAEACLLESVMLYIYHKQTKEKQNFTTTIKLLNQIECGEVTPTDEMLGQTVDLQPGVFAKVLSGLTGRIGNLSEKRVQMVIEKDELDLDVIGEQKTALFVVLPSNDDKVDSLVAMLLTQIQQRYELDKIESLNFIYKIGEKK